MKNGGANINKRTMEVIRYAGLILPAILVFYGLLIQFNLVASDHYVSDLVFAAIMAPWILLAVWQFLFPSTEAQKAGIMLGLYHIFTVLYLLFVSGLDMPFIIAWVLLFIASYGYFSNNGFRLSIFVLVMTALADSLLNLGNNLLLLTDMLIVAAILLIGVSAIAISKSQEIDGRELDISKAKEALQRDRIMTIVNNLSDAVISTDSAGVVQVYNAACLNLLDTNSNLNGKSLSDILSLQDSEGMVIDLNKELKRAKGVTVRDDLRFQVGEEVLRIELTHSPIRSSYSRSRGAQRQDGYILILRDVTKTKSLEEEKDEFISVVSHELRTPITIAEGTISNARLIIDRPGVAKKTLAQALDTAHEQVVFLARMVNDLSTLSRAERGVADEPELIDVRDLIGNLYTEYLPQAQEKKLHFNLDVDAKPGQVMASQLYLKELLQNFVTNAIKYTKEGEINLKVKRNASKIHFEVSDTGIGISKGDQAKIFDKFYRSEDYRTRETGGTGLGLYVAIKLAKKLNTKIELKSRLNHGSTFGFSLPVAKTDDKK